MDCDVNRDRDNVPDDRLIEGVWPDPDTAAEDRRERELSAKDFASPFKDAA